LIILTQIISKNKMIQEQPSLDPPPPLTAVKLVNNSVKK
jgi:hypothetical protein